MTYGISGNRHRAANLTPKASPKKEGEKTPAKETQEESALTKNEMDVTLREGRTLFSRTSSTEVLDGDSITYFRQPETKENEAK